MGANPDLPPDMSKTLLITGGAGFIGSALIRQLLRESDYGVVNVDKLTYAASSRTRRSIRGIASSRSTSAMPPNWRACSANTVRTA